MGQRAITILSDRCTGIRGRRWRQNTCSNMHQITVSKETLRQWMAKAGLWRAGHRRVVEVHQWRPRRSRYGELVQWDTSTHDWLEGRANRSTIRPQQAACSRRWCRDARTARTAGWWHRQSRVGRSFRRGLPASRGCWCPTAPTRHSGLRRGRHWCTSTTRRWPALHNPAFAIHCRSVPCSP